MKKSDIINAWAKIREENNTIPDDVLDFMKDAAIEKLLSGTRIVQIYERCKGCGQRVAKGNDYCGECMCEDDCEY